MTQELDVDSGNKEEILSGKVISRTKAEEPPISFKINYQSKTVEVQKYKDFDGKISLLTLIYSFHEWAEVLSDIRVGRMVRFFQTENSRYRLTQGIYKTPDFTALEWKIFTLAVNRRDYDLPYSLEFLVSGKTSILIEKLPENKEINLRKTSKGKVVTMNYDTWCEILDDIKTSKFDKFSLGNNKYGLNNHNGYPCFTLTESQWSAFKNKVSDITLDTY